MSDLATYLVLGDPIAHSLSPVIQQAAFDHFGISAQYERRWVDDQGLQAAVAEIRSGVVAGANVTMPHKALAANLCDELVAPAQRIGAVNTLWAREGKVYGTTTDPEGVRYAWQRAGFAGWPPGPHPRSRGSGRCRARSTRRGVRSVCPHGQNSERGTSVVRLASDASVIPWGTAIPNAVVVNATPIGMGGESLPPNVVEGASGLLEMTYGANPSPATTALQNRGLPVAEGLHMLVGQGLASFKIWTDFDVSADVMLEAALTAQSG